MLVRSQFAVSYGPGTLSDVAQLTSYMHKMLAYDYKWLNLYTRFRWISRVFFEFSRDTEWFTAVAMFWFLSSFMALILRRTT